MSVQEQVSAACDKMETIRERLKPQVERAKKSLELYSERAAVLMKEHPGVSLLCAAGAGFLVARLALRRW